MHANCVLCVNLVLCHSYIDGWPGLESDSSKPRGFLRSAQSNPGHPINHSSCVAKCNQLRLHHLLRRQFLQSSLVINRHNSVEMLQRILPAVQNLFANGGAR